MKRIIMSVAATAAMATATMAGGDIVPVEVQEAVIVPWTGIYVGGAATANQTYVAGNADWFSTSNLNKTAYGLQGNAGYTFFNNGNFALSAEGRLGGSVTGDDYVETSYWDIYAKPEVIFDGFSIYGLAGYGELDYTETEKYTYGGLPVEYAITTNVTGFTWGIGAQFALNDSVSVFADYVVQPSLDRDVVSYSYVIDENSIETDVISLGVNYRF